MKYLPLLSDPLTPDVEQGKKNVAAVLFAAAAVLFMANTCMAWTAPATGSFAYDLYDLVVVQGIQGAIGFISAVFLLITGIFLLVRQMVLWGVTMFLAAGILAKADAIITSLGAMIT